MSEVVLTSEQQDFKNAVLDIFHFNGMDLMINWFFIVINDEKSADDESVNQIFEKDPLLKCLLEAYNETDIHKRNCILLLHCISMYDKNTVNYNHQNKLDLKLSGG